MEFSRKERVNLGRKQLGTLKQNADLIHQKISSLPKEDIKEEVNSN